MALTQWKLQDAKNHFSELVELTLTEGPQEVTRRGEPTVVILSFAEYQELTKPKEDLVSFFENSPMHGLDIDFERTKDFPRENAF